MFNIIFSDLPVNMVPVCLLTNVTVITDTVEEIVPCHVLQADGAPHVGTRVPVIMGPRVILSLDNARVPLAGGETRVIRRVPVTDMDRTVWRYASVKMVSQGL